MLQKFLRAIVIILFTAVQAQGTGIPHIENFTRKDYTAGSQNWDIVQGPNNWMYFANKSGVLQYDGTYWKLFPLREGGVVRSLHVSRESGRIYVGGVDEFGYLAPEATGEMAYHCLSETYGEGPFGNVWYIYEIDRIVYFCCDHKIIKWQGDSFTTLPAPDKIDCVAIVDNAIYIGAMSGLYILAGSNFYPYQKAAGIAGKKIRSITELDGAVLIATEEDGLFLMDEDIRPFPINDDGFINENGIFTMTVSDGRIAVGTVMGGAVVLDYNGRPIEYINDSHGLQNNTVLSLRFDNGGNLWFGLDNGIDCSMLSDPVRTLYAASNFHGAGYAATVFGNMLYLGTNRGLFYTAWPFTAERTAPRLMLVDGLQGQVWSLHQAEDVLICCMDKGLYAVNRSGEARLVGFANEGVWRYKPTLADPSKAWVTTYSGAYLADITGGILRSAARLGNFDHSIHNFMEVSPGSLLIRPQWKEMEKALIGEDLSATYEGFGQGILDAFTRSFSQDSTIFFSAADGIYYLDGKGGLQRNHELEKQLDAGEHRIYRYFKWEKETMWGLSSDNIALLGKDGIVHRVGHRLPLIWNFESVILAGEKIAIIPNENGFAFYDPTLRKDGELPGVQLNEVRNSDSRIYLNGGLPPIGLDIPFKNNSLRLRFGLSAAMDTYYALYRTRLDRGTWSEWTENGIGFFDNIPIGRHTCEIEALFPSGQTRGMTFEITVAAPWYRTPWAFAGYLATLAALSYIMWKLEEQRVERKKRQVEIVGERKMLRQQISFRRQSEQQQQEILRLRHESLKLEIRHKDQELANTAINLARKNEVLMEVVDELNNLASAIGTGDAQKLKLKLLGVRDKVGENITHDNILRKFEEHFDLVHNNFMQKLSEKYPSLSVGEKKMCAFIKMHLSSKEIAPLLNISVRGAETMRYRLRKKFGLHREESLTQFLTNF